MTELRYHPVGGDIDDVLGASQPVRLLVIGDDVPGSVTTAAKARFIAEPPVQLPEGIYTFASDQGAEVLAVRAGSSPGTPLEAGWDAHDEHPLINAYGWFTALWSDAHEIPAPAFGPGDQVVTVPGGQEGTVRGRDFTESTWWYKVRLDGRTSEFKERSLTAPELDDDPYEWVMRPPTEASGFAATLTRSKLLEELTDTVYSFRATKTIFRPYQFRPVIRLLNTGSLKLLIADEVGLGKTIEAGLIWTELDARKQANRVLVVCPSMLVPKWRAEMVERFGYDMVDLDRTALDEMLEQLESDRLPSRFRGVCSLERLRMWDGLDRLQELAPRLDLVIVDEAHALRNAGTRSHALGTVLTELADALVFLSATPLNLGNDDLYNLLELLAPGEFDDRTALFQRLEPNAVLNRISASFFDPNVTNPDRFGWLIQIPPMTFGPAVVARPEFSELIKLLQRDELSPREIADAKRLIERLHALSTVVTRTRKVEIQEDKAVREAHSIEVELTRQELDFYRAFERWQRLRAQKLGLPIGFVTQMPLRLASSCLPAARDRVLSQAGTPWSSEDLEAQAGEVDAATLVDLDAPPTEVVDLARRLGSTDSKFDKCLPAIRQVVSEGHQALMFTFSRAALAYLEARLRPHIRLAVMHGDVKRDERHDLMRRFREGEFAILLASRVASEGLDFEFCGAIFNWDLPWNPMEVEQRIGRIDRFGQKNEKVLVFNFHTPGTIESDIIQRVHDRIGVFESSIGELEPILQSHMSELEKVLFDFSLSDEQRERRQNEILTAIEEQALTLEELETARDVLSSTDQADIDGLEEDLLTTGRYVGQEELVLLLQGWAERSDGRCKVSTDRTHLVVNGSATMESHLRGVGAAGERSSAEVDRLARDLRDGLDIHLCLEQELARTTGQDLLNANHPLVRAALRSPGNDQARLAVTSYEVPGDTEGEFLVLLSIARWSGAQPSREFWTTVIDLHTMAEGPAEVGAGLLTALAEANLSEGLSKPDTDLADALRRAERVLRRRKSEEEEQRQAMNDALVETRRISLRETHDRKVTQIKSRISTLRSSGKTGTIRMHEGQLSRQAERLQEAETELEAGRNGSLEVEHVAVCLAQVGALKS